jgi:hypothetical protein
MNKVLRNAASLVVLGTLLAGCSSDITADNEIQQGPVGVGRSINELKGTPCACTEIPMMLPTGMAV